MTPQEFKAWFEGFTEAFNGVPTKAQWARVKERVAEIDGQPITERIYLDRYWPPYRTYPYWVYHGTSGGIGAATTYTANCASTGAQYSETFNSTDAMTALGRADAQSLSQ